MCVYQSIAMYSTIHESVISIISLQYVCTRVSSLYRGFSPTAYNKYLYSELLEQN